jgi:hypothetical protein
LGCRQRHRHHVGLGIDPHDDSATWATAERYGVMKSMVRANLFRRRCVCLELIGHDWTLVPF